MVNSSLLQISLFLVLVNVWLPSQFGGSGGSADIHSTGRMLQNDDGSRNGTQQPTFLSTAYFLSFLSAHAAEGLSCFFVLIWHLFTRGALFFGAFFALYTMILVGVFVRPREANIHLALEEQSKAFVAVGKGKASVSTAHLLHSLTLLGRPLPDSTPALVLSIVISYIRALMALIGIGRTMERVALRLGRRSAMGQVRHLARTHTTQKLSERAHTHMRSRTPSLPSRIDGCH